MNLTVQLDVSGGMVEHPQSTSNVKRPADCVQRVTVFLGFAHRLEF
jgi:hypothetical protein